MQRTIHLHGALGRKFGKRHRLDVSSPAEAVRALGVLKPGFIDHIKKGRYEVRSGDIALSADHLTLGLGRRRDIHITPAPALAGIETILLIGLAIVAVSTIAMTFLAMPKPPKAGDREDATKQDSFIFDGATNSTEQGHAIPLIYGQMMVGSIVASSGIATTDINAIGAQYDSGNVGVTPGVKGAPGGDEWSAPQLAKGGKGGGGAARSAQEDPNTLQSQASARVIDIIGEGEIGGLVDGLKSVFFDATPVQNPDASYNFSGLSIDERVGLPDQEPLSGFSQTENSYSVDARIKNVNGPVTRRLLNDDADVARVTIGLPRLFKQDTTNGDLKQHSVAIAIDYQSANGGFTEILQHEFRGKTNSPYQRSFDIRLTGPGPHDIRVRRLSPDATLASIEDVTNLDLITEIVEAKLIYPDTALIGISVDARQFGTSIPTRSYLVKGLIIEVPSNYDPIARTYTGAWDGTFKRAWTNNPAWIYRDLIINKRYGLGRRIPATAIDKWGLYAISQYCDGLVPDGKGGTQPRYTLNCVIKTAEAAYDVLASVASAFRGWTYWGAGAVVPYQDAPADPSHLVTPANVIDGKISYDRITPLEKRRSVVIMYWNDPEDGYRLVPEVVERPDLIARFGWRPGDELTAFGCTNRAEARRKALWVFEDEDSGNTSANYQSGDDHAFATPGAILAISDPRYTDARMAGRVLASDGSSITLDAPVTLAAGRTYYARVTLPDGTVSRRQVTRGAGQWVSITLGGVAWAIGSRPLTGAIWSIESNIVADRQFRLRSISTDEEPYAVRAISHDPAKYARVEEGRDLPEVNFLEPKDGALGQPSQITISEFLLRDGNSASPAIRMAWAPADDPRVLAYQAQYRRPGDGWTALADGLDLGRDIRNAEPGTWKFRVRSLDGLGRRTAWLEYTATISAATASLPNVTGLAVGTDDIALTSVLKWSGPAEVRPLRYEVLKASTNNFAAAVSIGQTDQNQWPVPEAGFYWVRTAFMAERSAAPPMIQVTAAALPNPQWTRVDDRPLNLAGLDTIAANALADAQGDIADLVTTYGSTASAAQSAIDAAAARDTAIAQASAASGSSATAAGHATTATNKASEALGSASAASGSASTAATQAGNASTAAGQAATSASNAAGSASSAASNAVNAANSATAAGSSAGAATISASSASTSATNAATSASAASASEISARIRAVAIGITPNADFSQTSGAGWYADSNNTPIAAGCYQASFEGRVDCLTSPPSAQRVVTSELIPVDVARRYRLNVAVFHSVNATPTYLGFLSFNGAGTMVAGRYPLINGSGAVSGWHDYSAIITGEGASSLNFAVGTKAIRLVAVLNYGGAVAGYAGLDKFWIEDVEESEAALGSASAASASQVAASNSASSASSSTTTAANHASAAAGSASSAASSASAASAQASIATTQAAAAASIATLAASIGPGLRNPNATFAVWSDGSSPPESWTQSYGTPAMATRIAGDAGGYAYDVTVGGGATHEIYYAENPSTGGPRISPGWYVIELDIEHVSGDWKGAGCRLYTYDSAGNLLESASIEADWDATASGEVMGNTPAPGRYSFRKLWQASNVNNYRFYFGVSGGGLLSAKAASGRVKIRRVGFRPATPQEIRDQTVLAPLQATVTTHSGAIATIEGKTVAYLENQVIAGSSRARLSLYAVNVNGQSASAIDLQADSISLGTLSQPVLEVVGGSARVNGNLSASAGIALGATGNLWPIALKPKDYVISDGTVVDFGINIGSLPQLDFSTQGLDVLGSGENYDLYAESLSATGFTARLKIKVPGTPSQITLNTDTTPGTGPTRQIDKGSNADATDGNYQISYSGQVTVYNYFNDGGGALP